MSKVRGILFQILRPLQRTLALCAIRFHNTLSLTLCIIIFFNILYVFFFKVMQEMWGQGGAGQPSQAQKFEVFQEPSKPKQPTFEVFQEPPAAKPKPFEIFQESSAPTAKETKFEIFQDKENQLVSKPKPVIRDENDFPAAEPKFQKTRKSGTHFIIY